MPTLKKMLKQLHKERSRAARELERFDDAITALRKLVGREVGTVQRRFAKARRTLSAAARKKIAAAQRLRWAKVKQQALKKVT